MINRSTSDDLPTPAPKVHGVGGAGATVAVTKGKRRSARGVGRGGGGAGALEKTGVRSSSGGSDIVTVAVAAMEVGSEGYGRNEGVGENVLMRISRSS